MQDTLCVQPPAFNYITLQTTKACNLRCRYCYLDPSRVERKQKLSIETTNKILTDIVEYHVANKIQQDIAVVFHGGEALILGHAYYREVLNHVDRLRRSTPRKRLLCSVQSNVTLLDDAYCEIFKAYDVSIGTSLDGPSDLHNANRFGTVPKDNHAKVMEKIGLARKHGLRVGALCLITKDKLASLNRIFDFFENEGLNFKTNRLFLAGHAKENEPLLNVTEAEYATFTCELFDLWYARPPRIIINNLMQIMGIVLSGFNVGGCSHSNCSSNHVTITPTGDIYTCGRTTQDAAFCLGNVKHTSFAGLARTPNFLQVARRTPDQIDECSSCDLRSVCGSGCMYEAYLRHGTIFSTDGSCETFRKIFTHIRTRLHAELTHLSLEGAQHV